MDFNAFGEKVAVRRRDVRAHLYPVDVGLHLQLLHQLPGLRDARRVVARHGGSDPGLVCSACRKEVQTRTTSVQDERLCVFNLTHTGTLLMASVARQPLPARRKWWEEEDALVQLSIEIRFRLFGDKSLFLRNITQ